MKRVRHRTRGRRAARRSGIEPGWLVLGAILVVGLGAMVAVVRDRARTATPSSAPIRASVVAAELADPRVAEVERRFLCPCGRCGNMQLPECSCDVPGGALEVRGVIADLLARGLTVEETVAAVARRYGSLAPDPEGTEAPSSASPEPVAAHAVPELQVAAVASRLRCFCGRCSHRLDTCDCSHPSGARTVKAFIRARLAAGDAPEVVATAVEREFGGSA